MTEQAGTLKPYCTDYWVPTPNGKITEARFCTDSDNMADHIQQWNNAQPEHSGPCVHRLA